MTQGVEIAVPSPPESATSDIDPYHLVSSYYGPGAVICWYLLVASVVVTLFRRCSKSGSGLGSDYLAILLYAVISATDLAVQLTAYPYASSNLVLAFFLQHWDPGAKALIERGISPEEIPHILAAIPPFYVSMRFLVPALFVAILCEVDRRDQPHPRTPRSSAVMLLLGAVGWNAAVLLYVFLRSPDISIPLSVFINPLGQIIFAPVYMIVLAVFCIYLTFIFAFVIVLPVICISGLVSAAIKDRGVILPGVIGLAVILPIWYFNVSSLIGFSGVRIMWNLLTAAAPIWFRTSFVPQSGVAISELDQVAAVIAGSLTLGSTVFHGRISNLLAHLRGEQDGGDAEMGLASETTDSSPSQGS